VFFDESDAPVQAAKINLMKRFYMIF